MGKSMADYSVLNKSSFKLEKGAGHEMVFTFSLEEDLAQSSPIIAFKVDPIASVKFAIDVNGQPIAHRELNLQPVRGLWEIFDNGLLKGGTNKIQFRVESGKALFEDIVLWYQRIV